jgi:FkbM family methyltransferase
MRNDILRELRRSYPDFSPTMIFDVGANVGQSVDEFRSCYPDSYIHAFEPVANTFGVLAEKLATDERAEAHHVGLSSASGQLKMKAAGTSTGNRVVPEGYRGVTEQVSVATGQSFCAERHIDRIGFLKIDTEGHDLEVARGFEDMLRRKSIDFIQFEVGLSPQNTHHVGLIDVMHYMFDLDYRFFRLVGLHPKESRPPLIEGSYWGDAIFVPAGVHKY